MRAAKKMKRPEIAALMKKPEIAPLEITSDVVNQVVAQAVAATPGDETILTTHEVAHLLQMDASTISKWIDKGKLLAFRTPGGHRRVRVGDLRAFAQQHRMALPEALR